MFLSWRGSFWSLWLESIKVECPASASLFLQFLPGIESNSANGIPADLRGMMALRRAAPDPLQYRSCCTCTGVLRQREKKVCFPPFIVWLVIQNLIQSWLKSQGAACASEPWIWAFPNHFCTNKIKLVEKNWEKRRYFLLFFFQFACFQTTVLSKAHCGERVFFCSTLWTRPNHSNTTAILHDDSSPCTQLEGIQDKPKFIPKYLPCVSD